jgi:uncharacterized cupin superfamily protein
VVEEARLEETDAGIAATTDGWFVLNAREARWRAAETRGAFCELEGRTSFPQIGIGIFVLGPGEPMSMYHWEADQEDFLVVSGEALLVVEGEERPLRQWDFVHCPPETKHTMLGAGDAPCVIVAVGARDRSTGPDWGETETNDPKQAYSRVPHRKPTPYRDGWLPG